MSCFSPSRARCTFAAAIVSFTCFACSSDDGGGGVDAPTAGTNAPTAGTGTDPAAGTGGAAAPTAGTPTAGTEPGNGTGGAAGAANGGTGGLGVTPPEVIEMLDPSVDWSQLILVYENLYTAFDGEHTFQVPVYVDGVDVPVSDWEAIPASAVTFDADPDTGGVMVTIVEYHPEITIAAHAGNVGGTAPIYVTEATPAQWELGNQRYNNGVDYMMPNFDPLVFLDPNYEPPLPPGDLACNNCHGSNAKYFEIQHTPTQAARISDEQLQVVLKQGMKPEGVGWSVFPTQEEIDRLVAECGGLLIPPGATFEFDREMIYSEFHTWDTTDEEVMGLIVYLRSLTPEGQGDIRLPDGTYAPQGSCPTP